MEDDTTEDTPRNREFWARAGSLSSPNFGNSSRTDEMIYLEGGEVPIRMRKGMIGIVLETRSKSSGNKFRKVLILNSAPVLAGKKSSELVVAWVYDDSAKPYFESTATQKEQGITARRNLRVYDSTAELPENVKRTIEKLSRGETVQGVGFASGNAENVRINAEDVRTYLQNNFSINWDVPNQPSTTQKPATQKPNEEPKKPQERPVEEEPKEEPKPKEPKPKKPDTIVTPATGDAQYIEVLRDQVGILVPGKSDQIANFRLGKGSRAKVDGAPVEFDKGDYWIPIRLTDPRTGEETRAWIPQRTVNLLKGTQQEVDRYTSTAPYACDDVGTFGAEGADYDFDLKNMPAGKRQNPGGRRAGSATVAQSCKTMNKEVCEAYKKIYGGKIPFETLLFMKGIMQQESHHRIDAVLHEPDLLKQRWTQDEWKEYLDLYGITPRQKAEMTADHPLAKKFKASYCHGQILYPTALGEFKKLQAKGLYPKGRKLFPEQLMQDAQLCADLTTAHLMSKISAARTWRRRNPNDAQFVSEVRAAASAYNAGGIRVSDRDRRTKKGENGKPIIGKDGKPETEVFSVTLSNHDGYDKKIEEWIKQFRAECKDKGLDPNGDYCAE